MKRSLALMGIGAGLMYLLDPELGAVRRSMLKDRFQELMPQTNDALAHKASEVVERATEITERADAAAADTIQHLGQESADGDASGNGASSNGSAANKGSANGQDELNTEPAS